VAQPLPPEEFQENNLSIPDSFRWSWRDLAAFTIAAVLTYFLVTLGAVSLKSSGRVDLRPEDFTTGELLLMQGLLHLILVGFVVLIVKVIHRRPLLKTLHWHRTSTFTTASLVKGGILLAVLVLVISGLLPPSAPTPIERQLRSMESMYLFALFAIGIAPFVEEIIVRGFLFEVFSDVVSLRAAVPLTTLLFAGLHVLQLWGNWGAMLLIFGVGYTLGVVRYRSGSLISCWIIHTTYNAVIFGLAALATLAGLEQPK
jgi:membrane protease YdiL (CAAX protease family)